MRNFFFTGAGLLLLYGLPLSRLATFALQSSLYSHIVLIPFISLYLIWQRRATLPPISAPDRPLALLAFAVAAASLAGALLASLGGIALAREDSLALTTLSFLGALTGLCAWQLGREKLRAISFPLAFLVFMIPLPKILEAGVEFLLQQGSAAAAQALFTLAGTTVFADGLVFQLPGITLQIAPECSGIHSSLALFICSILAGYFFLRSPVRRAALALAVIPLALLRNGLRVFVLGELCVRKGPEMIDSPLHHQGGPYFFVLSLIPFFLLLLLLMRTERPTSAASGSSKTNPAKTADISSG